MNDFDFENDPIFSSLKSFAAAPVDVEMPHAIKEAFIGGKKKSRIRKYGFRGLLSALLISISIPALAATNVLPETVKHFVQSVQHVATNSVKHFVNPVSVIKDAIQSKSNNDELPDASNQVVNMTVTEDQEDEVINGSQPTEGADDTKSKEKDKEKSNNGLAIGKEKKSANLIAASPATVNGEDDNNDSFTVNNSNNRKTFVQERVDKVKENSKEKNDRSNKEK